MSKIIFAEDAWEEYLYWQSQDKKTRKTSARGIMMINSFPKQDYVTENMVRLSRPVSPVIQSSTGKITAGIPHVNGSITKG